MKRPIVLLLADEPKIARAIGLLLSDWDYQVVPGSNPPAFDLTADEAMRTVGIIVDLVTPDHATDLMAIIQGLPGVPQGVPILACTPAEITHEGQAGHERLTLLRRPIDPLHMQRWLDDAAILALEQDAEPGRSRPDRRV